MKKPPVPEILPFRKFDSEDKLLEMAPEEARPWMFIILRAWQEQIEEDWGDGGEIKEMVRDISKDVVTESIKLTVQYLDDNKMLRPQFRNIHPDIQERMHWESRYEWEMAERLSVDIRTVRRWKKKLGLKARSEKNK
ncbi:MAG: hypothetical protein ACXADB_12660 [Candidatus Hermodarchaeia archaeon]|jgi:hypothetical protein